MKWPLNAATQQLASITHPENTCVHTHSDSTAVCGCWNLPIILYFTGPSLHRRCDWNNNRSLNQAILLFPVGQHWTSRGKSKAAWWDTSDNEEEDVYKTEEEKMQKKKMHKQQDYLMTENWEERKSESRGSLATCSAVLPEWHSLWYPPLWGNNPLNPACSFR